MLLCYFDKYVLPLWITITFFTVFVCGMAWFLIWIRKKSKRYDKIDQECEAAKEEGEEKEFRIMRMQYEQMKQRA
jgi:hypothetical protein